MFQSFPISLCLYQLNIKMNSIIRTASRNSNNETWVTWDAAIIVHEISQNEVQFMKQRQHTWDNRRTVKAPHHSVTGELPSNCVVSVELAEDEEVSWAWTQLPMGEQYVSGYSIRKKSSKN